MGKSLEHLILEALAQGEEPFGQEGQRAKKFVNELFNPKPGTSSGAPKKPSHRTASGAQGKQKKAPSTFEERQRQRAEKLKNQGRDGRKRAEEPRAAGPAPTSNANASSTRSALGKRAETANRTLSAQRSYEEQKEAERRYREYKELLEDNENLPFEQDPPEENSASGAEDEAYSEHELAAKKAPWSEMRAQLRGTDRQRSLQQALLWREILGPPKSRR